MADARAVCGKGFGSTQGNNDRQRLVNVMAVLHRGSYPQRSARLLGECLLPKTVAGGGGGAANRLVLAIRSTDAILEHAQVEQVNKFLEQNPDATVGELMRVIKEQGVLIEMGKFDEARLFETIGGDANSYDPAMPCRDLPEKIYIQIFTPSMQFLVEIDSLNECNGTLNLSNRGLNQVHLAGIMDYVRKSGKAEYLRNLDLSYNQLTTLPADVFAGLERLEGLDLRLNQLTTLPAGVFAELIDLQYLNLWDNPLTTLPADLFAGLERLRGWS